MSSFLGMDVQAIRALSTQLSTAATDISQHASQINTALQSAQWTGTDAAGFRSDWGTHYQNLTTIAQALTDASTAAGRNADQQEQASGS